MGGPWNAPTSQERAGEQVLGLHTFSSDRAALFSLALLSTFLHEMFPGLPGPTQKTFESTDSEHLYGPSEFQLLSPFKTILKYPTSPPCAQHHCSPESRVSENGIWEEPIQRGFCLGGSQGIQLKESFVQRRRRTTKAELTSKREIVTRSGNQRLALWLGGQAGVEAEQVHGTRPATRTRMEGVSSQQQVRNSVDISSTEKPYWTTQAGSALLL